MYHVTEEVDKGCMQAIGDGRRTLGKAYEESVVYSHVARLNKLEQANACWNQHYVAVVVMDLA